MEVDDDSGREMETSKKIEKIIKKGEELLGIKPSSLSGMELAEEMTRLFEEEIARLKKRSGLGEREGNLEEKKRRLGLPEDEDVILGRVIVAGGASREAKRKKNKKKRKAK